VKRTSWQALCGIAFLLVALHDLEEAVTAPAFLRAWLGGFEVELPRGRTVPMVAELDALLAWATLLAGVLLLRASRERAAGWGTFAACALQVFLIVNLLPHAVPAVLRRAYVPGLATSLAHVPLAVVFLRRARRDARIGRRGLAWAGAAGAVTYPLVLAALYVLGHFSLAALAAAGAL